MCSSVHTIEHILRQNASHEEDGRLLAVLWGSGVLCCVTARHVSRTRDRHSRSRGGFVVFVSELSCVALLSFELVPTVGLLKKLWCRMSLLFSTAWSTQWMTCHEFFIFETIVVAGCDKKMSTQ